MDARVNTWRDWTARREPRATMRRSMIDGGAFSIMVGLGEWYLPAFVLALAFGEVASGLVATVPMVAGSILQLAGFAGVRRLGSHKRWVLAAVALQACSFLPLAIGAALGAMPLWAVFTAATMYWAGGLAGGAAWSTWIGTLIPNRCRSRFFGRRQRVLQAGMLAGFLAAGFALFAVSRGVSLDKLPDEHARRAVRWTFCGLFAVAALCRSVSWWFLLKQPEPDPLPAGNRSVGPRELLARLVAPVERSEGRDARLIVYMIGVSFATQFSAAYVNPYVLKEMGCNFFSYAMLIGMVPLAKTIALAAMGRLAARLGARRVLLVGGLGIVPISALWAVSTSLWWLGSVQLCSGVMWAAWELGTFLLILEHLKAEERTSLMATFYVGNSACYAAGSLAGGWLLSSLGTDAHAYAWLFTTSTVLRALTIWPLVRLIRSTPRGPRGFGPDAPPRDQEAWPEHGGPQE